MNYFKCGAFSPFKYYLFFIVVNVTCSFTTHAVEANKQLTLATTKWCPYTCAEKGYEANIIGKYVTELLEKHNIMVNVQSYPWARAVHFAEINEVDGLLTATPAEAPNLSFTTTPIANFHVCFYTHKTSDWQYQSPLQLDNLTLGVIKGYGYQDEIDKYISLHSKSERIVSLSGNQGLIRLISILKKQRVDIIVEDKLVMNWQAKTNNIDLTDIKNAGCTTPQPFYLALNVKAPQSKALIELLDIELARQENQQKLQQLIEQYAF
ncbi:substrate-binding periplasmic protein [Litorilituus lipolyticus]|uniref:ABC transporter substrate-binding protein n=1 Tax=Litorilituus lipolyticus TaxID=2491017 RepID=A0A502L5I3_9GAMM|nr:transporter substrate-binding domain-containing protein [Litorilituus lipolyticus]TPH17303.1 ABC transporter substrate-binding protein [Litorilituus lipolyticus]